MPSASEPMPNEERHNDDDFVDASKLSFEEYHAISTRKRKMTTHHDKREHMETSAAHGGWKSVAGSIVEMNEIQCLMIFLSLLDLLCVSIELYMKDRYVESSILVSVGLRLNMAFTGFTLFFFFMELCVASFAFRWNLFSHVGYVLDFILVFISFTCEICGYSKGIFMHN